MRILLGVCGCIAAYKSAEIVRAFQKKDVDVSVVMTSHAAEFIGSATFRALTGKEVGIDNFAYPDDPIPHITLSQNADAFLIAPCTANVIGKIASGIADDLLTSCAIAATCPVIVAPAMNVHMLNSDAVQENIATLKRRGFQIIEPANGYLACGDVGEGRLPDPEDIVEGVLSYLCKSANKDLLGLNVMITAGPTVEKIDPVRFISNRSSGKMGYSIAERAQLRGANVTLITGPVSIAPPCGVHTIDVESADEMLKAAEVAFEKADIAIFTAAVCDLRPEKSVDHKLKKGQDDDALSELRLIENPDILKNVASNKRAEQLVVGFAAETDDVIENAKEKLTSKGADLIVANDVSEGKAFGKDELEVTFVTKDSITEYPMLPKSEVADILLDTCLELLNSKR